MVIAGRASKQMGHWKLTYGVHTTAPYLAIVVLRFPDMHLFAQCQCSIEKHIGARMANGSGRLGKMGKRRSSTVRAAMRVDAHMGEDKGSAMQELQEPRVQVQPVPANENTHAERYKHVYVVLRTTGTMVNGRCAKRKKARHRPGTLRANARNSGKRE